MFFWIVCVFLCLFVFFCVRNCFFVFFVFAIVFLAVFLENYLLTKPSFRCFGVSVTFFGCLVFFTAAFLKDFKDF